MLRRIFATDDSPTLMYQRLVLGAVMFPHGIQKLLGWWGGPGWSGTLGMFDQMGMPAALAALVIIIEFFGALGLLLGLGTRIAALGITAVMIGAIATVHGKHGFFAPMGFEYHLLALGLSIPLIVQGGGKYALDAVVGKLIDRGSGSAPAAAA